MKVCDKHKEKPAFIYGQCIGCELDELRRQLKLVQSHAKRLMDTEGATANWNRGYQAGLNDSERSYKEGWTFGREQEKLRFDENATFTAEIMKLESALESLLNVEDYEERKKIIHATLAESV